MVWQIFLFICAGWRKSLSRHLNRVWPGSILQCCILISNPVDLINLTWKVVKQLLFKHRTFLKLRQTLYREYCIDFQVMSQTTMPIKIQNIWQSTFTVTIICPTRIWSSLSQLLHQSSHIHISDYANKLKPPIAQNDKKIAIIFVSESYTA